MTNHKKSRWTRIAFSAAALATIFGSLSTSPVQAVTANPTPSCSNGSCSVTFDYSGDYFQWSVPAGIRALSFELYGAQGGRSGGFGAKLSGQLKTIPSSLWVYVGGQGLTGTNKAGGYNGGGATSATGHGDEGSGGGASDIRTSAAVTDRILVAGGGGGNGGWVGGAGGVGGGTIAGAGAAAAGTGGGGGTQLAGGSAGIGSATGNANAGATLNGGAGGAGSAAGGGGGGGGYFGGGGGGGDSVPSGLDGGGGGGGSSYANIAYAASVAHSAGNRAGNGQVVLTYSYAPTVTTFAPTSSISNSINATFNLGFSQNVFGLDATDFTISGTAAGCFIGSVTGATSSYVVVVSGCSDGAVILNLATNAVTGATTGPVAVATSSSITLDRAKPNATVTSPAGPVNSTSVVYSVAFDEPVTGISATSFTIAGTSCVIGNVSGTSKTYSVTVDSCASASTAVLTLKAFAGTDAAANQGPAAAVASTTLVDRVIPAVSALLKSPSSRQGMQVYELTMAESVTGMANDAGHWTVSGAGCAISKFSGSGASYTIWVTGCNDGVRASITLKALSLTDAAGNIGPAADFASPETQIDDQLPRVSIIADARATQSASPSFTVTFSEQVTGVTLDIFTHSGTANNCKFALAETTAGLVYKVTSTLCGAGTLKLGVPANAISDANGNLGPSVSIESAAVTIDVDVANGVVATKPKPKQTLRPRGGLTGRTMMLASLSAPKQFKSQVAPVVTEEAKRWLITAGLPLIAGGLLTKRRR